MATIEVSKIFTAKVIPNGGSLQITIPSTLVDEEELQPYNLIEVAYIKRIGMAKRRKRERRRRVL